MASDGPPGADSNIDINTWTHGELQAKLAEFGAPNMGEMETFEHERCGGVWLGFLSLASVSRLACYVPVCCSGLYCTKPRAKCVAHVNTSNGKLCLYVFGRLKHVRQ